VSADHHREGIWNSRQSEESCSIASLADVDAVAPNNAIPFGFGFGTEDII